MRTLVGFIFLLACSLYSPVCVGQVKYVPPKIKAKDQIKLDQAILSAQSGSPENAIQVIRNIIDRYPSWTKPRQELGRIYYEAGKIPLAIAALEANLAVDTLSQLQQLHTLGRLYEETNQPAKAIACYRAVIQKGIHQQILTQRASASLLALEQKVDLWRETYSIELKPFSSDINTPNHESLGRWTLDGQKMVFTRLLNGQEDIFIGSINAKQDAWVIEDFPFNTPQNEGAHAISPDGKYLIFTSCNRSDGLGSCDLYLSTLKNGVWTSPVNMGPAFNTPSWDGHPCFGLDGMSLFFSSGRPGGMGGRDIWYVIQLEGGKWSAPINAGPMINTPNNEESPFIHFDGQVLYFMRDGKEGLGGFDLYLSRKAIDGVWQQPENMGAPINSGAKEGALSLHPDGRRAIITRETHDQLNDLFEFELPEKFRALPLQALHVSVQDDLTHQSIRARLEIFEVDQLDTIRLSQWADDRGNITSTLQRNKSYGIIASADGYMMYSSYLEPDTHAVRHLNILMTTIASSVEKVIVLENIFFESGSFALLPTSDPELKKLIWTLSHNEKMKIEIRGHTDDVGDEQSNRVLSEARAQTIYQYLVSGGIHSSRLSYVGFGETQPVAENTNAEGRRKNRRTEFRVISN